jgi:hypothetical protein
MTVRAEMVQQLNLASDTPFAVEDVSACQGRIGGIL